MKKALSLILALVMVLSLTVPAFAETDNSTDITLTVEKSLTYDMVIPEDVTNLNAAGIYSVGQAKVANVKNATDNTVISYTAETTAFKCEGKTDIPASYYTDEAGQNDFPTTAVEVYENKKDAENIPTMYVGISETDWDAAENGTYTATVTFNFSTKEVTPVTAADALEVGAQLRLLTMTREHYIRVDGTYQKTDTGFSRVGLTLDYEDAGGDVNDTCTLNGSNCIVFTCDADSGVEIEINPDTGMLKIIDGYFTQFEVKPAGATEFTIVPLTIANPK